MTDSDKLKAILNLACVVMSRKSTPAMRERAERLLACLSAPISKGKNTRGELVKWDIAAREACPEWGEL
jgi:hypothetical protein